MICFNSISKEEFLTHYWQKKPLVLRKALPEFQNPLTADELAGLALEDEVESRLVWETQGEAPNWHLQRGPFSEKDFANLPASHWTLLVQGVDRLIPEVYELLNHFDFIPQWRIDDIMISFAALSGSVGPHYDNYDVFLYQAQGRREWRLTTAQCKPENYLENLELRIMRDFPVEETLILEEGDMLYLPPHVGHYGISLSKSCMTYSFGYRSYQAQELWDSLGDYASEKQAFTDLYQDPDWSKLPNSSELNVEACKNAQTLLLQLLQKDAFMQSWFGCFATRLDPEAERQLPMPLADDELVDIDLFVQDIKAGLILNRHPSCRFAYQVVEGKLCLYLNGCEWPVDGVSPDLVKCLANHRHLTTEMLNPFLDTKTNQSFLYDLWKLQWLENPF